MHLYFGYDIDDLINILCVISIIIPKEWTIGNLNQNKYSKIISQRYFFSFETFLQQDIILPLLIFKRMIKLFLWIPSYNLGNTLSIFFPYLWEEKTIFGFEMIQYFSIIWLRALCENVLCVKVSDSLWSQSMNNQSIHWISELSYILFRMQFLCDSTKLLIAVDWIKGICESFFLFKYHFLKLEYGAIKW